MKVPSSTYRIQFHAGFPFESALGILHFLQDLGISHIYASPILKAKKGSMHGYDVVDPTEINPELGGRDKLVALIGKSKECDLGWIQDIVPNHMAYDSQNSYVLDLLEKGTHSKYREYFDIDWKNPYDYLQDRLLAPFLGEFYGTCLDKTAIQLHFGQEGFSLRYEDIAFPVRIDDYPALLKMALGALEEKGAKGKSSQLTPMIQGFEKIKSIGNSDELSSQITSLKASLSSLARTEPLIAESIDTIVHRLNGMKDQPATLNALDDLHSKQNFRFSYWKISNEELNYRRFFTVNNLICLKTESKEVFDFSHRQIFTLLKEQTIDGLRIDHIDGLYNPVEYLSRIREVCPDLYIVAEKIVDLFEPLPHEMKLQGTTGYDFLNFMNGIFVDCRNEKKLTNVYSHFTGLNTAYEELVIQKKHLFMNRCLGGDIYNLAYMLKKTLGISRYGRDMTTYGLKRALFETFAHFPVYRTYVSRQHLFKRDEGYIKQAISSAKNSYPSLHNELDLIEGILLLQYGPETPEAERAEWARFTKRFQQLSCALMAKGVEDTIFYVYNRLLSLNEVGSNPSLFGIQIRDFHECNQKRCHEWPYSLNATSTHDTKRGEDVRARLNVLSEIPHEWGFFLKESAKANRYLKKIIFGLTVPDKNEEYFIYQTLVGAYPFFEEEVPQFKERLKLYIVKALREALVHTSWTNQDLLYEETCVNFVDALFDVEKSPQFLRLLRPFCERISFYGIFNSLSQVLLKIASPGVPDLYQGTETWALTLVDPDNRRAVDFEKRRTILQEIQRREGGLGGLIPELLAHKEDGKIKLFTIYRLLKARNQQKDLFQDGSYIPLEVKGMYHNNIIAFARKHNNSYAIAIAPRFLTALVLEGKLPLGSSIWQDTAIPLPDEFPLHWTDAITGQVLTRKDGILIGEAFKTFPGCLLIST